MLKPLKPSGIHPPFSNYNHGIEVPAGYRLVLCSGQIGVSADEDIPPNCADQAEICFDSIEAILGEAGMTLADVVRINAFVSGREHLRPYMEARNRRFPAPYPASTLMVVSGFARPEFVVEVEVIAAAPESAA